MGNSASEQVAAESKQCAYLTKDEQSSLLRMYQNITSEPEAKVSTLVTAFDAKEREEFNTSMQRFYERNIKSYDQFESFVVNCTRSPSNKIIETFWEMASGYDATSTEHRLTSLVRLVLELSLANNDLADIARGDTTARVVDFVVVHFAVLGICGSSTYAVTAALTSILNNYLPCTSKALETYISRVCFQGLHSPSYKPFLAPKLDFPSEILGESDLLPLALHSESLQGAWKRLYSTSVDGLSFNRIVYHSLGYDGPTCVLVKCADALGTVLGMLAFDHWKESNRFYGAIRGVFFVSSVLF